MRVVNSDELMIRWAGGDHTPLRVKKNQVGQHRWTAGADVVELVTALAVSFRQGDCGDSQPRRQVDRSRQRMNSSGVCWLRNHRGIPPYRDGSRAVRSLRAGRKRATTADDILLGRPPDTSVGLWCKPARRPSISPCCQASEARSRPCSVPGQVLCL